MKLGVDGPRRLGDPVGPAPLTLRAVGLVGCYIAATILAVAAALHAGTFVRAGALAILLVIACGTLAWWIAPAVCRITRR